VSNASNPRPSVALAKLVKNNANVIALYPTFNLKLAPSLQRYGVTFKDDVMYTKVRDIIYEDWTIKLEDTATFAGLRCMPLKHFVCQYGMKDGNLPFICDLNNPFLDLWCVMISEHLYERSTIYPDNTGNLLMKCAAVNLRILTATVKNLIYDIRKVVVKKYCDPTFVEHPIITGYIHFPGFKKRMPISVSGHMINYLLQSTYLCVDSKGYASAILANMEMMARDRGELKEAIEQGICAESGSEVALWHNIIEWWLGIMTAINIMYLMGTKRAVRSIQMHAGVLCMTLKRALILYPKLLSQRSIHVIKTLDGE
jgi:hypothetical protein